MGKSVLIINILLGMVLLAGCATVLNAGNQHILVEGYQNASNVAVEITTTEEAYKADLPTTVIVSSSHNAVRITVVDRCYNATDVTVARMISPYFLINFLFWPGFVVDALSGRLWSYADTCVVPLTRKENCE